MRLLEPWDKLLDRLSEEMLWPVAWRMWSDSETGSVPTVSNRVKTKHIYKAYGHFLATALQINTDAAWKKVTSDQTVYSFWKTQKNKPQDSMQNWLCLFNVGDDDDGLTCLEKEKNIFVPA